jgi:predicted cupin superfamily sugar epimerase
MSSSKSGLDERLIWQNFDFKAGASKMTTTTPSAQDESPQIQKIIKALGLETHVEGGYFVETDRDPLLIPNPFLSPSQRTEPHIPDSELWRNASTSIFYLITPQRPLGRFHRNKGRTVHTLHSGRGIYVLLHADELQGEDGKEDGLWHDKQKVRIESFVVGRDVARGERLQWIVEGGKYKASFLLDVEDGLEGVSKVDCTACGVLLISEVCFLHFGGRGRC